MYVIHLIAATFIADCRIWISNCPGSLLQHLHSVCNKRGMMWSMALKEARLPNHSLPKIEMFHPSCLRFNSNGRSRLVRWQMFGEFNLFGFLFANQALSHIPILGDYLVIYSDFYLIWCNMLLVRRQCLLIDFSNLSFVGFYIWSRGRKDEEKTCFVWFIY